MHRHGLITNKFILLDPGFRTLLDEICQLYVRLKFLLGYSSVFLEVIEFLYFLSNVASVAVKMHNHSLPPKPTPPPPPPPKGDNIEKCTVYMQNMEIK